ncbi:hypothetical protein BRD17_03885 [Halobacteriales archaeon SW_7_68_16]|nr:MAG: hypothetical protein BRD17_03885 [Halobacteriales archaeon SW_7_68_16]
MGRDGDAGVDGPRAVAVNVAANTTLPGLRGPVFPDRSFAYLPIPEREPTDEWVPTYADLIDRIDLHRPLPDELLDRRVHLDPAFAGYPHCETYTYGDEHGVKARPLAALEPGDYALFYATLTRVTGVTGYDPTVPPEWGAFLIGGFRLSRVVTGEAFAESTPEERHPFRENAHLRRETVDAEVFLAGDPDGSTLFDRAVSLSAPDAGATAGEVVTGLSTDSGRGPWWRRPLRFDREAAAALLDRLPELDDGEKPDAPTGN